MAAQDVTHELRRLSDWGSAEVQEGQLSVPVQPDPDFAFIEVFDTVLIESPAPPGAAAWGQVQFAGGRIVVSEVQRGSASALEQFLDGVVPRLQLEDEFQQRD